MTTHGGMDRRRFGRGVPANGDVEQPLQEEEVAEWEGHARATGTDPLDRAEVASVLTDSTQVSDDLPDVVAGRKLGEALGRLRGSLDPDLEVDIDAALALLRGGTGGDPPLPERHLPDPARHADLMAALEDAPIQLSVYGRDAIGEAQRILREDDVAGAPATEQELMRRHDDMRLALRSLLAALGRPVP